MKIYHSIEEFKKVNNAVVTIGTFDGVHSGHRVILDRLKSSAAQINGETVLLTFFPHPRMVLYPDDTSLRLLNTIDERKQLLKESGIDHLIIHSFSKAFSRLTSLDFVRDILVGKIGVAKLVIGYDHHFGRNREGSMKNLQEFGPLYGFDVEEIPVQEIEQTNISSTKIRNALLDGKIDIANRFLGYHYFFCGEVVNGDKKGRTIGFPTANIQVSKWYKLIPKQGVYAVRVYVNQKEYGGMLNIGDRPTVNGTDERVEVHIFDFDRDIYGEEIRIALCHRIRDEQRFEAMAELKKQLEFDKEKSLQLLDS